MKFQMGVFRIRNLVNGKFFVGSSTDLKAIWFAQKLQLNAGMHPNSGLQADWKELGSDSFIYEILEVITPSDDDAVDHTKEIKALESLIIEELQPLYNKQTKDIRQ